MTYLNRLRTFWAAYRQQPFSTAEVTLYTYLADEADRLSVDKIVRRDTQLAMDVAMSVNTLKPARAGLLARGMLLIDEVTQGSKAGVGYGFTSSVFDEVNPVPAPSSSETDKEAPHQKLTKSRQSLSETDEETSSKTDEVGTPRQKLMKAPNQKLMRSAAKIPELIDFQRHRRILATAILVLKGKRKSIVYTLTYANTLITFSTTFSAFARKSKTGDRLSVDTVIIGQVSVDADELFTRLNIRGVKIEQINAFVEANASRAYNDLSECGSVVRSWLRKNRPSSTTPALSVGQRKLALRDELNAFHLANRGKYPIDCYKSFYDYYAETSKGGRTIRKDSYAFFDLGPRLEYHYKNHYLKRQHFGNGQSRQERQLGTVTEQELAGTSAGADYTDDPEYRIIIDLTDDSSGADGSTLQGGDTGGVFLSLE